MATIPRLAEHVEDIAGRLTNILTAWGALELAQASGVPFEVATLRLPSSERWPTFKGCWPKFGGRARDAHAAVLTIPHHAAPRQIRDQIRDRPSAHQSARQPISPRASQPHRPSLSRRAYSVERAV
jgi:hypothetical protein